MIEEKLSHKIVGAAIEVHRTLGGPGLLESIYEAALCHELLMQGCTIEKQKPIHILYKGIPIKDPLYLDILVDNKILIEVKATEKITPFLKHRCSLT